VVEAGGLKVLVHHIVTPEFPGEILSRRLQNERPGVVLFGHTHRPYAERHDGIFFLNPGYSGRPRMNTARSVALIEVGATGFSHRFIPLR
jgi:uncharacterized protein